MAVAKTGDLRPVVGRAALVLVLCLLLVYPVDWAIWRIRMAFGGGMDNVTVTSTTAATLKGNHFEVYSQDQAPVACSRSMLPEAGAGACWWLRSHPQVITQY